MEVEGSFDSWQQRQEMVRSGKNFQLVKLLPPGIYQVFMRLPHWHSLKGRAGPDCLSCECSHSLFQIKIGQLGGCSAQLVSLSGLVLG